MSVSSGCTICTRDESNTHTIEQYPSFNSDLVVLD